LENQNNQTLLLKYKRLAEISRDLASMLDISTLLRHIVRVAAEISDSEAASILLYDQENHVLQFEAASNIANTQTMLGMVIPENSIAGWVAINRKPAIVDDVHQDLRFFSRVEEALNFPTRSLAAIPLIASDSLIGVLEVVNKRNGEYSDEDIQLLIALGAQAAVAIHISRLFQQTNLIADFVHEIRTPLASINTLAFILPKTTISDEQRQQMCQTIQTETQRLSDLATSFLDLASLESGRVRFRMSFFDIHALLKEVIDLIAPKAKENEIEILAEVPADLPPIEADREKLKQVFINLVSNAVKYNRQLGKVWIRVRPQEAGIQIEIEDTGLGIPEDQLANLFEKFFRARNVERSISGTGLGLSISKRIIDNHAGTIQVSSAQDKGTIFRIWLPLVQSA